MHEEKNLKIKCLHCSLRRRHDITASLTDETRCKHHSNPVDCVVLMHAMTGDLLQEALQSSLSAAWASAESVKAESKEVLGSLICEKVGYMMMMINSMEPLLFYASLSAMAYTEAFSLEPFI